jgi:phosphoribosylanthranilate isomerase
MTRIKVCGVRRQTDVERCVDLGVDMIGFNCWAGSPRHISPSAIRAALGPAKLGPEIALVFVRAAPEEVERVVEETAVPLDRLLVQLHGGEDPTRYARLGVRLVQVLRVGGAGGDIPFPLSSGRVLLDVHAPAYGGTGQRIPPEALEPLLASLPREWILAGGLDAANVADAVRRFSPWGVDVASGVELEPGVKDHGKLQAFVEAVRGARSTRNDSLKRGASDRT